MKPLLTILTITKDDASGLDATIGALRAWENLPWVENVVVYAGKRPCGIPAGWQVLEQAGAGIAEAFNQGLGAAKGEWVWCLNGGDRAHEELDPGWLRVLLAGTSADIVTGAIHRDGEATPLVPPAPELQWPLTACWLAHPATLVRRRVLENAGGFDPRWRIAMDYDLWHRLLAAGARVDVVAMPFACFDVTGVSERAETRAECRAEDARLMLREAWPMTKACLRSFIRVCARVAHAAVAVVSGRAGARGRP